MRFLKTSLSVAIMAFMLTAMNLHAAGPHPGNQVQQAVLASIRGGNAGEITKYMNTLVDFDIPGNRGTFSKSQGGRVLGDFLSKNPVSECTVISTGNSTDGGDYTVGDLKAGGKSYRLYFVLKEVDGKWLIHIFKITPQ
jgi:hypothetical protein